MDRDQILEEANTIEDKLGDMKFTLDVLTDEIRALKNETEKAQKNAKRHKTWYEEILNKLEDAENQCMDAYDNLDEAQTNLEFET